MTTPRQLLDQARELRDRIGALGLAHEEQHGKDLKAERLLTLWQKAYRRYNRRYYNVRMAKQ